MKKFKSEKMSSLAFNEFGYPTKRQLKEKIEPVRTGRKIGRNEPCTCYSGKKYKHCHWPN